MIRPNPWRRRLLRARIALYAALFLLVGYGVWRYDIVQLPGAGCSPLEGFYPGDRIVVERSGVAQEGDAVLFEVEGELLLGRVGAPPPSAPADVWEAWQAGGLWILNENEGCPAKDSRVFGVVAKEALRGRLLVALPW